MSDPTPATAAPKADAPESNSQTQPETDWKAKYEAQQKVNRDLEGKFNAARDQQTKMTEALTQTLGLQSGQPYDISVLAGAVQDLSQRFEKSQAATTVLTVANEHGITDKGAIADLAKVTDPEAMRSLAARIAAAATPGTDTPSTLPGPRPDLSQGAQGTTVAGTPATDFERFLNNAMSR